MLKGDEKKKADHKRIIASGAEPEWPMAVHRHGTNYT
jgi:hypothetical protein